MASAFAHIAIPAAIYCVFRGRFLSHRLFWLAAVLSVLPDADVIAFHFGIPYESQWGHRGFTHSIAFSLILAISFVPFHNVLRSHWFAVFAVCFIACASHTALDAMTNGGLGVAVLWPFDADRYFLPIRPIQVSPIGVEAFFSDRGIRVLLSESIWVFLPAIVFVVLGLITKWLLRIKNSKDA